MQQIRNGLPWFAWPCASIARMPHTDPGRNIRNAKISRRKRQSLFSLNTAFRALGPCNIMKYDAVRLCHGIDDSYTYHCGIKRFRELEERVPALSVSSEGVAAKSSVWRAIDSLRGISDFQEGTFSGIGHRSVTWVTSWTIPL